MFWIFILVLLAGGIGFGLRLGAISASFSFVGLIFATLLAPLIGKIFKFILPHVGVDNPLTMWFTPPICGFFLVWILFMVGGFEVHRRVSVFYKYKAGDLLQALWERLNLRVGGCVGVLIGVAWIVLASFVIFTWSYATAQVAPSENESFLIRTVNSIGQGIQSTGLNKSARAVGSVPDTFYRTANFFGLLAQNPDFGTRLGTYPAFITLSERDDVKGLAQDSALQDAWRHGSPMSVALNNDQVKRFIVDTNMESMMWSLIQTNMDDMTNYLFTGQSAKYDPIKIVGRWSFDLVPALLAERQKSPKMRPEEMKALRDLWTKSFKDTTFVAAPDGQAFLKSVPDFSQRDVNFQNWTGTWSQDGANYDLSLSYNGQTETATATTDGLRMTVKMNKSTFVFQRIYN